MQIDEDAMEKVEEAAYARFKQGKPFPHREAVETYLLACLEQEEAPSLKGQ